MVHLIPEVRKARLEKALSSFFSFVLYTLFECTYKINKEILLTLDISKRHTGIFIAFCLDTYSRKNSSGKGIIAGLSLESAWSSIGIHYSVCGNGGKEHDNTTVQQFLQ